MNKFIKFLNVPVLYGVMLIGMHACRVDKEVKATNVPVPEAFRDAPDADTASVANLSWKQFFTDPILLQHIDSALQHNYDMQTALQNIDAAKLMVKQAKAANLPDISASVNASLNRPSDNSLNGLSASQFLNTTHVEDYSVSLLLSWEADIWGKIRRQKAAALAGYLQTEEARKAIQTQIVAGIANSYYSLLMLDQQLDIAKKNVLLNDSTLRILRLQFNAGEVTSLAVEQAEAQQQAAAQLIPLLEQRITIQENAFKILSGELPGSVTRNAYPVDNVFAQSLTAGVPAAMVRRRPDVRSQELELDIANAKVGIAKANMYPTLNITASGGLNSFQASNWFNVPASLFGVVGGGLVQPVLQRKQLKTQYELAKVDREKTVIGFRSTVLNAVGEVSDALVQLEKLKQQQLIAEKRTATLQQAIEHANLLFRQGKATYLEVITAQANVLQSELGLVEVETQHLQAGVELYRSLGGGAE